MSTKGFSVEHRSELALREHVCLVMAIKRSQKDCLDLSLAWDVADTCWKVSRPAAVAISHAWTVWLRGAVTGAGGFHSPEPNLQERLLDFGRGPYSWIAMKVSIILVFPIRTRVTQTQIIISY